MIFRALLLVLHWASALAAVDLAATVDDCTASEDGSSCALSALQIGSRKFTGGDAAAAYFDQHAVMTHLTRDELRWYRHRFVQAAEGLPAEALPKVLEEQRPILTQWVINQIRGSTREMEMQVPADASSFTLKSSKESPKEKEWWTQLRNGVGNVTAGDIQQVTGEMESTSIQVQQTPLATGPLPDEWDSTTQWPQCKEVFTHVRNQGRCSNCWAQSAAGTMDGRLCIASSGSFSGERAWTSASYITSCYPYPGMNGCSGGNAGLALMAMANGGVPTGSPEQDTCVPQNPSGNFVDMLTRGGAGVTAPPCPSSCTADVTYPRSLTADRFFPTGQVVSTSFLSDMQQALMQHGPLPMSFNVYTDFLFLMRGRYDHSGTFLGNKPITRHATLALGWTQYSGETYVHGVNSWGTFWGDNGQFWMKASCCALSFYVPQTMVPSQQAGLPLPGPGGGTKGLCNRNTGGTCWFWGCDRSRGPTSCVNRQCQCTSDFCALNGQCVTPVS